MKAIIAIAVFSISQACTLDQGEDESSISEGLYGPLQTSCPLAAGCVVSGYRFGDAWTIGGKCNNVYKKHAGIDLRAAAGTVVYAAYGGRVVRIYDAGANWGKAMLIQSQDAAGRPFLIQYMHVSPSVSEGATIARGAKIAVIASISGAHLHLGVWNGTETTASYRGALPPSPCGGDPAWPSSFEDPARYIIVR